MPELSIAIIDSNMLASIGLELILKDIMPADIQTFSSFEELTYSIDKGKNFIHFFVASRIYFEHTQFFRYNARKSVVLVNGDMQINGMKTINVQQNEKMLIKSMLALHNTGHGPGHPGPNMKRHGQGNHPKDMSCMTDIDAPQEPILSKREIEVAVLLSKGCINKEIAEKLNISITTVITHRTHIMEKLKARSLADIIVYCVMNGYVEVEDL